VGVDGYEIHPALHQVRDKGHVARQAVQFGDDEGCAVGPTQRERLGQLWAIIPLSAFDLPQLRDELPAPTIEVGANGCLLSLET
jgi:hypothetical protein